METTINKNQKNPKKLKNKKIFTFLKDAIQKLKRQTTDWEKIFTKLNLINILTTE